MELHYFDLVVGIIILLLGLKGIINGFFKELFGLIGIIGGIFIASRLGDSVGGLISDTIFKFESDAAISFVGFVATLIIFWAGMIIIGMLFTKLSKASGLGPVDKVFGFIVGSGKFFLIGAVIAYAIYNVQAIRVNLEPTMKNSILFPILVEAGSFIMHIDPAEVSSDLNETVEKGVKAAQEQIDDAKNSVDETLDESAEKIKQSVKKHIEDNITAGE
ncbi:MAG: CvpA family protein [Helicobacteraceae bacterium]|jgi:membrane protein required for colicin V production|nr:CvpA family protein [Helicobacteraceae bacterium]